LIKRVHHVVSENERVLGFVIALRRGDLSTAGKLMYESHLSLRNDYEVSCSELDTIVDISATLDGVIGSRLTGAGFGGSAIVLVRREKAGEAIRVLYEEYMKKTGRKLKIYVTSPEGGVSVSYK
jgi:galactokinase